MLEVSSRSCCIAGSELCSFGLSSILDLEGELPLLSGYVRWANQDGLLKVVWKKTRRTFMSMFLYPEVESRL